MKDKIKKIKRKVDWSIWLAIIAIIISLIPLGDKYLIEEPKKKKEIFYLVANLSEGLTKLWLREYTREKKDIKPPTNKYITIVKLQATADQLNLKINIEEILNEDLKSGDRSLMPEYPPNIFRKKPY